MIVNLLELVPGMGMAWLIIIFMYGEVTQHAFRQPLLIVSHSMLSVEQLVHSGSRIQWPRLHQILILDVRGPWRGQSARVNVIITNYRQPPLHAFRRPQ